MANSPRTESETELGRTRWGERRVLGCTRKARCKGHSRHSLRPHSGCNGEPLIWQSALGIQGTSCSKEAEATKGILGLMLTYRTWGKSGPNSKQMNHKKECSEMVSSVSQKPWPLQKGPGAAQWCYGPYCVLCLPSFPSPCWSSNPQSGRCLEMGPVGGGVTGVEPMARDECPCKKGHQDFISLCRGKTQWEGSFL